MRNLGAVLIELNSVWVEVALSNFNELQTLRRTQFNWDKRSRALVPGSCHEPCNSARSMAYPRIGEHHRARTERCGNVHNAILGGRMKCEQLSPRHRRLIVVSKSIWLCSCQRRSKNASARRSKTTSQMVAARRSVRGALLRIGHLSGGLSTGAPRWRRLFCLSR